MVRSQFLGAALAACFLAIVAATDEKCPVVLPNARSMLRIVGGVAPTDSGLPFMVAFHRMNATGREIFFCTGSLLSSQWALTAAHCPVTSKSVAYVGGRDAASGQLVQIETVTKHPKFMFERWKIREVMDDDIAVVKFTEPFKGSFSTVRINSNSKVPEGGSYARAAGYGLTDPNEANSFGSLRQVDLPIKSSLRCQILFMTSGGIGFPLGFQIKDKLQMCAGYENGGCDSCQGDSGGPILTYDQDGNPVQVGVTSFGIGCGAKKRPGIYTRLSSYVDWLRSTGADFTVSNDGVDFKKNNGDANFLDKIDPRCFPADATVTLRDGSHKSMEHLEIGDEVLSSAGTYAEVFMFTHRRQRSYHRFVELSYEGGKKAILLSAGHYLQINGQMISSDNADVGDMVETADGSMKNVTHVSLAMRRGLYNPQTTSGLIVVNGVKSSTYTTAISPNVAHGMLQPLIALYKLFQTDFSFGALES